MPRIGSLGVRNALTHGQSHTVTYGRWKAMRNRCQKQKGNYKGIAVCARWDDYTAFLADMGECPEGMTLDRIDNAKGYEPSNCRWATPKEQTDNRECTHRLSDGRVAADVCKENGIASSCFSMRLNMGWPVDKAATTPPRRYRRPVPANDA